MAKANIFDSRKWVGISIKNVNSRHCWMGGRCLAFYMDAAGAHRKSNRLAPSMAWVGCIKTSLDVAPQRQFQRGAHSAVFHPPSSIRSCQMGAATVHSEPLHDAVRASLNTTAHTDNLLRKRRSCNLHTQSGKGYLRHAPIHSTHCKRHAAPAGQCVGICQRYAQHQ